MFLFFSYKQWTVNGELRIGFFALRNLEPGDEVTFNYQFERYGKEAQKCYCETPSCKGTIGASDVSRISVDGSRLSTEEISKVAKFDRLLKDNKDEFEDLAVSIHFFPYDTHHHDTKISSHLSQKRHVSKCPVILLQPIMMRMMYRMISLSNITDNDDDSRSAA